MRSDGDATEAGFTPLKLNVIGHVAVTQAFLPALPKSGRGTDREHLLERVGTKSG